MVGFGFAERAISTNPKPTIYHNFYENTGPERNMYMYVMFRQAALPRMDLLHILHKHMPWSTDGG